MGTGGVQGAGYAAAYAVVRDLLRSLPVVLVECVNPIELTRSAWANLAEDSRVSLLEVELYCSDVSEHRSRALGRVTDVPGLELPDWTAICAREYEPWTTADLRIDTSVTAPLAAAKLILSAVRTLRSGGQSALDSATAE